MKKQLAALFLMMVMMVSTGTAVAGGHSNVVVSTAVGVVKLPFKIVGGVVGGLVGAIPEHVKNGEYWTQTKLVMKNLKNGHRTELEIIKVIYDQGLKDNVFTESYLKRK